MIRSWLVTLTLVVAALASVPASAAIQTYNFTLGGFPGGGTVAGSFSGEDRSGNSAIDHGEVSGFQATFSGNAFVSDLTAGGADLASFSYQLGATDFSGLSMVFNINGVAVSPWGACDGFGACYRVTDFVNDVTLETTEVGRVGLAPGVPAPLLGGGLIPALAALLGLAGFRRRRGLRAALAA